MFCRIAPSDPANVFNKHIPNARSFQTFAFAARGRDATAGQCTEESSNSASTNGLPNANNRGGLLYKPMMDISDGEELPERKGCSPGGPELEETDGSKGENKKG